VTNGERREPVVNLLSHTIGGVWGSEPSTDEVDVDIVRSTNFTADGRLDYTNSARRSISERALVSRRLHSGDILLEKSGGGPNQPVGRVVFVAEEPTGPVVCSNFVQLLRPGQDVDPRWLFYLLWSAHASGETLEYQSQTIGIRNLRTKDYLGRKVAVPSRAKQTEIAETGRSVDFAASAARAYAARAAALYEALRENALSALPTVEMDDLLLKIVAGKSPRALAREPSAGERGVLKVSAVKPMTFVPSESKALLAETTMPESARVNDGDLLITRANTALLVGAVSLVATSPADLFLCDKTLRLEVDSDRANKSYLAHALTSSAVREQLRLAETGTSESMKNITQESIRALRLACPETLAIQCELAARLDAAWQITVAAEDELRVLTALKAALLTKVFAPRDGDQPPTELEAAA